MEIVVVNKRLLSSPLPGTFREYVGRPSPLGNPFPIGEYGNRKNVIAEYRKWFYNNLENEDVKKTLRVLKGKARRGKLQLMCWCAPLACHADVIKDFLIAEDEGIYKIAANFPEHEQFGEHFFKIDHSFSSKFPEGRENEWSESFWLTCLDDPSVKVEGYIDYDNLVIYELG